MQDNLYQLYFLQNMFFSYQMVYAPYLANRAYFS